MEFRVQFIDDRDSCKLSFPEPTCPVPFVFDIDTPVRDQLSALKAKLDAPLDPAQCCLQVVTNGNLKEAVEVDVDISLTEINDDIPIIVGSYIHEEMIANRSVVLMLRYKLNVRVRSAIENIITPEGPSASMRKVLFAMKRLLHEDMDYLQEFLSCHGMNALIELARSADSTTQQYVLRVLGELLLYLDGLNAIFEDAMVLQWLHSCLRSTSRLVAQNATELLLVFINCNIQYLDSDGEEETSASKWLYTALVREDVNRGCKPFSTLVSVLKERSPCHGHDLLPLCMTLINIMLSGAGDHEEFYDMADNLELHDMEELIALHRGRAGPDRNTELLAQFDAYEKTILEEYDIIAPDPALAKEMDGCASPGTRKRKSKLGARSSNDLHSTSSQTSVGSDYGCVTRSTSSTSLVTKPEVARITEEASNTAAAGSAAPGAGTSSERKQHDGAEGSEEWERQKLTLTRQATKRGSKGSGRRSSFLGGEIPLVQSPPATPSMGIIGETPASQSSAGKAVAASEHDSSAVSGTAVSRTHPQAQLDSANPPKQLIVTQMVTSSQPQPESKPEQPKPEAAPKAETKPEPEAKPEPVVKPKEEPKPEPPKPEPEKAKPEPEPKAKPEPAVKPKEEPKPEKVDLHPLPTLSRPLKVHQHDFTDLNQSDDEDGLAPPKPKTLVTGAGGGPPPPPPPPGMGGGPPPPPPPPGMGGGPPPPPPPPGMGGGPPPPPPPPGGPPGPPPPPGGPPGPPPPPGTPKGRIGTVSAKPIKSIFWKQVKIADPGAPATGMSRMLGGAGKETIWNDMPVVDIDKQKFKLLFEEKAKEKKAAGNKAKEADAKPKHLEVLEASRSRNVNISLTRLPAPRYIRSAITSMDNAHMTKDGLETLLKLCPTDEEVKKLEDAKKANPGIPFAPAEEFLYILSSIPRIASRICLWLFLLEFDAVELDLAADLKFARGAIEELLKSRTFKVVLGVVLQLCNYLSGKEYKAFKLDFFTKIANIKDSVKKQSLLYHVISLMCDQFPDCTDLFSDFCDLHKTSKVDFNGIASTLTGFTKRLSSAWDDLATVLVDESDKAMEKQLTQSLEDIGHRIVVLKTIQNRLTNRFKKALLFLGYTITDIKEANMQEMCKMVMEFSMDYRVLYKKKQEQIKKKLQDAKRRKTRGVMVGNDAGDSLALSSKETKSLPARSLANASSSDLASADVSDDGNNANAEQLLNSLVTNASKLKDMKKQYKNKMAAGGGKVQRRRTIRRTYINPADLEAAKNL